MKVLFRNFLRSILRYLSRLAIEKHSMEIIVISGWHGVDITKEAIYTILKREGKKVRRPINPPSIDWEVPLQILGVKEVPTNLFSWICVLVMTVIRLIALKPNSSVFILPIVPHDSGIMKFWMSFLQPSVIIVLNTHLSTVNFNLLIIDKLKKDGLLILNGNSKKTRSLGQGRQKNIIYYGLHKEGDDYDYSFSTNKIGNEEFLEFINIDESKKLSKSIPEFMYPFLTAALSSSYYFKIPFMKGVDALDYFEMHSEKLQKILHKFAKDDE